MKWRKKKREASISPEEHEKNQQLAKDAAMYAMFASNTSPQSQNVSMGKGGSGFDISNAQKIAAYNLLMNTRED